MRTNANSIGMLTMLGLGLLLIGPATGCRKKQNTVADTAAPAPAAPGSDDSTVREGLPAPRSQPVLGRVHFGYDRADLSSDARATLAEVARSAIGDPAAKLVIEGHADERGSTQYNLALSARRAQAVMRYLSDAGVPAARMRVVAFGEEKPLASGTDEAAWAQNRRAEVLTSAADEHVAIP